MRTIAFADKDEAKEILLALSQTLSSNNGDDSLSDEASLDNIERATIQVFCASDDLESTYVGTGLLLTEDGIFITAYHNVEPYLRRREITLLLLNLFLGPGIEIEYNGSSYNVSEVFCSYTSKDLALCDANIPKMPCKAIKFKTLPARISYINQSVNVISVKKGKTYRQVGKITSKQRVVKFSDGKQIIEGYNTNAYSFPGFSGAPVATLDGKLLGLCLYSTTKQGEELGTAGFTPVENIESMVHYSFQHLGKILEIR